MRVLLVPGGGAPVAGYFPAELEQALPAAARVIALDPPGHDAASGRRWLPLHDHARFLADAVRRDGPGRVVVVGHSLGGLIALRLALDQPDLVAALLLLDPSPPPFGALLPRPLLRPAGAGHRALRGRGPNASQEHSPPPLARSVPLTVRLRWFVVVGGMALVADVAAGGISGTPTILVSASANSPGSAIRRSHERLAAWIPGARFEVWPDTTHPLHLEQPKLVADAAVGLLREAQIVEEQALAAERSNT